MAEGVSERGVRDTTAVGCILFVCWSLSVLVACSAQPIAKSDAAVSADRAVIGADAKESAGPDLPTDQSIGVFADAPATPDASDVFTQEAAGPDTSACPGEAPTCTGCCGGTTNALCTYGQWVCPNINCAPCGDAGAPAQSCGVGEVVGPDTERCQAAGGVCVRFPDAACCTFAPGLAPDDSGCPRAPYAIRCCLLSPAPADGALERESGAEADGSTAVNIDASSELDANTLGPAGDGSVSAVDAQTLPAEFSVLAGASFTIAASATPPNVPVVPGLSNCSDSDQDAQYRLTFSADGIAVRIVPIRGLDDIERTGSLHTEDSEQLLYWVLPAHGTDDLKIWFNAGVLTAQLIVFQFGVTPLWCIQSPLMPADPS